MMHEPEKSDPSTVAAKPLDAVRSVWMLGGNLVLRIREPLKATSIASAPGTEGFSDFLEANPCRFVRRPRSKPHARRTVGVEIPEFRCTVLAVIHPIKVLGGVAEINAVLRGLTTQPRHHRIGQVSCRRQLPQTTCRNRQD